MILRGDGHENGAIGPGRPLRLHLVTLICLTVWGAFLPSMLAHNPLIYSWDSAAYIETANSINAGRGFVHRAIFGLNPNIWQPIRLWPPAYPILIAGTQLISGMPALKAGLVVSLVLSGIFIILLMEICLRLFHWTFALPTAMAAVFMPVFLFISTSALSDATFLVFVTGSLACLILWSTRSASSWMWLTAAGLLAGVSLGVRNTAVALIASTAIFLICHIFWQRLHRVIIFILVWLIGLIIGGGFFVIRNLLIFGQINPYTAPPSDLGMWQVMYAARNAIIWDMTASRTLASLIVDNFKYVFTICALGMVLVTWLRVRGIPILQIFHYLRHRKHHIFLISYALIYVAVIIVARTKYWLSDFPGVG